MSSTETNPQGILDLVRLGLKEKKMRVLGAVLRAKGDFEDYRDFGDIYQAFTEDQGFRQTPRHTVYEILSSLERSHFIQVDRQRHRHRYTANAETIGMALSELLSECISQRRDRLSDEIMPQEEELRDLIEDPNLGDKAHAGLKGRQFKSEPMLATELIQVENLVQSEVLSRCRGGDTIRVYFEAIEKSMLDNRSTIAIERFLSSGCDARMMLHSESYSEEDLAGPLKAASEAALRNKQKLVVRLRTSRTKVYEIVACGSRGIVLAVSRDPLIVTYVPRSANRTLTVHAIETFDKEFSESKLLLDTSEQESA